ncbi:hypothetical protein [Lysobacter fragariae]
MRVNVSKRRLALVGLVLVAVVASSGCSWFHRKDKLYMQDAQNRPLEVPPDLDMPNTQGATVVPGAPALASTVASPTMANGFAVAGSRDDVFAKVGEELVKVDGLTIASRAQLLGVYDVSYQGSNFLVRVSTTDSGAFVAAVDPRGQAAAGEGPVKLIAALKAALGGN